MQADEKTGRGVVRGYDERLDVVHQFIYGFMNGLPEDCIDEIRKTPESKIHCFDSSLGQNILDSLLKDSALMSGCKYAFSTDDAKEISKIILLNIRDSIIYNYKMSHEYKSKKVVR